MQVGETTVAPAFPKDAVQSNDNRSQFAFTERGKTYRAINHKRLWGCCLRIDGKMYPTAETKKCDFGLLIEDRRFYLIECKGVDINSAIQQLSTTVDLLSNEYGKSGFDYRFRVVAKQGFPKSSTRLQNFKKKIGHTSQNKRFLLGERVLEETL